MPNPTTTLRFLLLVLPFLFLPACSSSPIEQPVVASFTSEKTTVTLGESVTLRWSGVTAGATLRLSPGFGDVTSKRFMIITPTETTNYTLEVSNTAGSRWYTQLVTVTPANPTTNNVFVMVRSRS